MKLELVNTGVSDAGGTNGADAIVQSVEDVVNPATELIVDTFAAFTSTDNATFFFGSHEENETTTEGSGLSSLGKANGSGHVRSVHGMWRDDNDTTPSMTWATSNAAGGIGVELKRASACVGQPTAMEIGMELGMIEGVNK